MATTAAAAAYSRPPREEACFAGLGGRLFLAMGSQDGLVPSASRENGCPGLNGGASAAPPTCERRLILWYLYCILPYARPPLIESWMGRWENAQCSCRGMIRQAAAHHITPPPHCTAPHPLPIGQRAVPSLRDPAEAGTAVKVAPSM